MTKRGIDFVEDWVSKNVKAGGPSDEPMSASHLAKRCIVQAAAEGIAFEEIQPDSETLESYIAKPMVPLEERINSGD